MSTVPELKVQLSIRIREDLARYIREYAVRYTSGNISKAIEEILERCLANCGSGP